MMEIPGRLTRGFQGVSLEIPEFPAFFRKKSIFQPQKKPGKSPGKSRTNLGEVHVYFWRSTKSMSLSG